MELDQLEAQIKEQIIKSTAADFKSEFLQKGQNGIHEMLNMIYGGKKDISNDQIESLQHFIKKNKYDNEQNIIKKLTSILNEQSLKTYDENLVLNQLFQKSSDNNQIQINSNGMQDTKKTHENSNVSSLNETKIEFSDQRKSSKSRLSNLTKSIYSLQVDQLIDKMKKYFWGIDMERIGCISQKEDIKDFSDELKQNLISLKIDISDEEISNIICKLLNSTFIERIEIDLVEKIIVNIISNQTIIPLYKI